MAAHTPEPERMPMETAYWIVAGLLTAFYLFGGSKKLLQSQEALAPMMGWVDTIPMGTVRFIGAVEILGALGLVLPPLTGVAPVLALVSACGLAVLQVLAFGVHVSRREYQESVLNVVLFALAVAAAYLSTTWL